MIVRDEVTGGYVGIKCDKCEARAPSSIEIQKAHGLTRLGWYCSGGTHICPAHTHPASQSFHSLRAQHEFSYE